MGNRPLKEAMPGGNWRSKRESKTDQSTTLLQLLSEKETELSQKDRELVDMTSKFRLQRGQLDRKKQGTC